MKISKRRLQMESVWRGLKTRVESWRIGKFVMSRIRGWKCLRTQKDENLIISRLQGLNTREFQNSKV